jgi:uracil-DNA glycosylase
LTLVPPILVPSAPIYLLGEAPGADEEFFGRPFVGKSGDRLFRLLVEAGIDKSSCSFSNVFSERPPDGILNKWHDPTGKGYLYKEKLVPPLSAGLYISPERSEAAFNRIAFELETVKPNLIIALGNTALWALTGLTGITKHRGNITVSSLAAPGHKLLPTFHPAMLLRDEESHVIVVADLIKAKLESTFPEARRIKRTIWIANDPADIPLFFSVYPPAESLTIDIETSRGQITVVGFAIDPFHALVVPIYNKYSSSPHIWSREQELLVWKHIKKICESSVPKILQNGIYDLQYFRRYKINLKNFLSDTMILHYSLFSMLPKSLEFLGATYCNEISWKSMRPRGQEGKKNE